MQGLHDVSEKILHDLLIISVPERPTAVCLCCYIFSFLSYISQKMSVVSLLPMSDT